MPWTLLSSVNHATLIIIVLTVIGNIVISLFVKKYREKLFYVDIGVSLLIVFAYFIFALFGPHYFIDLPNDFSQDRSANIGNTVNGLTAPFVAIAAAILTFMAFFIQFRANQEMLKNNAKQQEERQFYRMLEIHMDNVGELEWKILRDATEYDLYGINFFKKLFPSYLKDYSPNSQLGFVKKLDHISTKGSAVFRLYLNEFLLIQTCYLEKGIQNFSNAYEIFFEGIENACIDRKIDKSIEINNLLECVKKYVNRPEKESELSEDLKKMCSVQGRCNVFIGHRDVLNSYYRHLYHTVAYVADSKIFDDDEKKKFLKILRSQMTSEEQAMLFLNWLSGYGSEWECENKNIKNHFFTKYKMIHNIELNDIQKVVTEQKLKDLFVGKYITEDDWTDLFEFNQRKKKRS